MQNHDYIISTEKGESVVRSDNWGSFVNKGTVLVMSMILKKVTVIEKYAQQRKVCPRCYQTKIGVMPDDGWLQWYVRLSIFLSRPLIVSIAVVTARNVSHLRNYP